MLDLQLWYLSRRRQQVIHEAAADQLSFSSITDLLKECGADALRNSALDLAVNDHRIDDVAAILRDDVSEDLHRPRAGVNLAQADVRCIRVGGLRRVV